MPDMIHDRRMFEECRRIRQFLTPKAEVQGSSF